MEHNIHNYSGTLNLILAKLDRKMRLRSYLDTLEWCDWQGPTIGWLPVTLRGQILQIAYILIERCGFRDDFLANCNGLIEGLFRRMSLAFRSANPSSILSRAAILSGQLALQEIDPLFNVLADHLLCLESFLSCHLNPLSASGLESPYDFLVSAVVLSIVYQYLIGYVDRGGTKTYNSGSLEFRATYVSLLLFRGAYVWIKFRDVPKRTVSQRTKVGKSGNEKVGKFLPIFKPAREMDPATKRSLSFQCLRLAGYDSYEDAKVVCQIAGYYYKKDEVLLQLKDGFQFDIPPMSEQERGLSGVEKWNWVSDTAKEVFKLFKRAHDRWREIQSELKDLVVQTQQSAGNVNDLHDPTDPQPPPDISDVLEVVSPGNEVTRVCSGAADYDFQMPENWSSPNFQSRQEEPNVQSGSAPNCAASAADAIVDNQQPLFAVPTTTSERADGTLSSGGTVEAGFSCGINEHEAGQDCWSTEFQRIMSEVVEFRGAGNVNDHIQRDMENALCSFNSISSPTRLYDPAFDPSLHDHTLPQPLSDVADFLDAFQEQGAITTQAHEVVEELAYQICQTTSTSSLEEAAEKATGDAHSEMRFPNLLTMVQHFETTPCHYAITS